MKVQSATFVTSAVKPSQYPSPSLPEIAFAGPSNVGKSSLLNALLGRKKLVKTSSSPGRTQTINFFVINGCYYVVDLPGYGYAKVPLEVRKQWGPMVNRYLKSREGLCAVVVVLDVRRSPSRADRDLLALLAYYGLPDIVVLTKADKLKKDQQNRQCRRIAKDLGKEVSALIRFSATTGMGKQELWKALGAQL